MADTESENQAVQTVIEISESDGKTMTMDEREQVERVSDIFIPHYIYITFRYRHILTSYH